jgi:molybdopterin/thiamine biosynthesis adenylyltransferase
MRYHRQTLLPQIGRSGQDRLAGARVLLVGCGALGTVIAELLTRAGVGFLRIADRDVVELTNLQRQVLFDEADARQQTPKAVAAANRLARVNSSIVIDPRVVDVHPGNIESLAGLEQDDQAVNLILDGTDNAETRYLINDVSVKHGVPWIYGACVGMEGRVMNIHPPQTACLRCLFPEPPGAGELPTCDTAGVFGPAASVVASLQAAAAIKLLASERSETDEQLISLDAWKGRFHATSTASGKREDCPTCARRMFTFLDAGDRAGSTSLCGRDAVQVRPAGQNRFDLERVAEKLAGVGQVERTPYLLRCELPAPQAVKLTLFSDGRLIVHGTSDLDRARSLYARYVGI